MSGVQNGVPAVKPPAPHASTKEAHVMALQQQANVYVARFVNSAKQSRVATMLLVLVSLPHGRVRSLYAPINKAEQTAAVDADVLHRNAEAIRKAVQFLARGNMAAFRQIMNYLAVALGLAPMGGPPFLGLGNEPRNRGGSSSKKWGPSWPADLPAAVAAMADRLNTFVDAHLNEGA
ncbi:hypothetical protein MMPV_004376 [Pyropia vietnamensis]